MTDLQTRYSCHNSNQELYTSLTTKRPMFLSDYNQIFIITFPYMSPIYFKEIRPLEGKCGQTHLAVLTMQTHLEKKFVNYSMLNYNTYETHTQNNSHKMHEMRFDRRIFCMRSRHCITQLHPPLRTNGQALS
jgi:hypothetical protein